MGVKIETLHVYPGDLILNPIVGIMLNKAVDAKAEQLSKDLKSLYCKTHPDHITSVIVSPKDHPDRKYSTRIAKCCCDEFRSILKNAIK